MDRTGSMWSDRHGRARPILEPLTRPRRAQGEQLHRVSATLDHERFVAFRALAADQRLSGDDLIVLALDRLLLG